MFASPYLEHTFLSTKKKTKYQKAFDKRTLPSVKEAMKKIPFLINPRKIALFWYSTRKGYSVNYQSLTSSWFDISNDKFGRGFNLNLIFVSTRIFFFFHSRECENRNYKVYALLCQLLNVIQFKKTINFSFEK